MENQWLDIVLYRYVYTYKTNGIKACWSICYRPNPTRFIHCIMTIFCEFIQISTWTDAFQNCNSIFGKPYVHSPVEWHLKWMWCSNYASDLECGEYNYIHFDWNENQNRCLNLASSLPFRFHCDMSEIFMNIYESVNRLTIVDFQSTTTYHLPCTYNAADSIPLSHVCSQSWFRNT